MVTVTAMIYLVFNEGYSASEQPLAERAQFCDEAIRLTRLLLRLFPMEAEVMGLLALQLLQHARLPARYDTAGSLVLLEHQDRNKWNGSLIAEGLALIDKAIRHRSPGPYQIQAAIAALHARAKAADQTDWSRNRSSLCIAGMATAFARRDAQSGGRRFKIAGA